MKLGTLAILLIHLFCLHPAYSQDRLLESDYAKYIQSLIGGEREVTVEGGRIDLLSEDIAFEIEWASNWKEAIGQALWYALQTNKKPGIILILEERIDYKYLSSSILLWSMLV